MKQLHLLMLLAASALAQDNGRAVIRTSGQYDQDGTILYNVYVASKEEDVEQLTISAALPSGTRFMELVHKPQDAIYDGVEHDTIFWRVPKLDRDTLLGPFVFRVSLDGTTDSVTATILAAVAYQRPLPELKESPAPGGKLVPSAKQGSITIDARGTLDATGQNLPVPIGDTGVILFVPEGAVSQRVTLSVNRLNLTDFTLPQSDPAIWWCSLYQMTSEPQITFSKAISASFPNRRDFTPGYELRLFTTADIKNWGKASATSNPQDKKAERAIGFGIGGQFGGGCGFQQFGGFTTCGFGAGFGFGGFGAFGFNEQVNQQSKVTAAGLGTPPTQILTAPPSIIAILIGMVRP